MCLACIGCFSELERDFNVLFTHLISDESFMHRTRDIFMYTKKIYIFICHAKLKSEINELRRRKMKKVYVEALIVYQLNFSW